MTGKLRLQVLTGEYELRLASTSYDWRTSMSYDWSTSYDW